MLKYIFSALLIAAVWTVVLLLDFPMWWAIVATAVILVILFTIVIVKVVRAKKAAKEIEKALQAQAAAHAANARPDLKAEVDAMQGEFMKAVQSLKASKLGGSKGGANALYALPWYMIIGPPGSGKSTALRNSGLRFPYSAGAVQGMGGTRNCQWWMTNEAVILDTAGRYTTEDADRDEWMAFLDLLKKNRPKRPVNGVLVAIPCTELAEGHPEEVLARAREIRARVDEVMQKLQMVVPVYVLFTKCDLLPGFVEMFNDLNNTDRSQIWGFTVPVTGKGQPAKLFDDHFNELAQIMERRQLRRLHEERSMEARDKIFAFSQYFEPLRENLSMFVGELMAESIYTESPIFRGAYFTSGTQEGRPIDKIMNSMAEAFGIQPQMGFTQPQVEAKSYFLGQVFQRVIFPDKNVATRSASLMKRKAMIGHLIALCLVLLAIGLAVLPVISFDKNRTFTAEADEAVETLAVYQEESTGEDPIPIDKLSPIYSVERTLDEHEESVPLFMRMGMYQGHRFNAVTERVYVKAVRKEMVEPLYAIELEKLKAFAQKYAPLTDTQAKHEEHQEFRARLRAVLLLSGPYEEGEPGLDENQRNWLSDRLGQTWGDLLEQRNLAGEVSTMKAVSDAFVDNLAEDPETQLFDRGQNKKLIKTVRKILKRTNQTQALLNELIRDIEAGDLTLSDMTASTVALKNDNYKVKGAYTRNAWEDQIRTRLENPLDNLLGEEWVLGRTEEEAEKTRAQQVEALKSLYFENYIREWKRFISSIYVDAPGTLTEARRVFEDLTRGGTPPYKRLCQNVYYHTNLPGKPKPKAEEAGEGLIDKGLDKVEGRGGRTGAVVGAVRDATEKEPRSRNPLIKTRDDVRETFEGLAGFGYQYVPPPKEGEPPPPAPVVQVDRYQEELQKVRDALIQKIDVDDAESAQKLASAVKTGRTTVDALINESDLKGWRNTLQKWLPPPFHAVNRMVLKSGRVAQANEYCEMVYKPMMAKFLGKYPFATKGKMVRLKDFSGYFKPESGELWAYYASSLASVVPRKHGTFGIAKRGAADKSKINPQVVKFLNRAQDVTTSMFPTGAEDVLVEFPRADRKQPGDGVHVPDRRRRGGQAQARPAALPADEVARRR